MRVFGKLVRSHEKRLDWMREQGYGIFGIGEKFEIKGVFHLFLVRRFLRLYDGVAFRRW
jgi:hypothetical protein